MNVEVIKNFHKVLNTLLKLLVCYINIAIVLESEGIVPIVLSKGGDPSFHFENRH